MGQTQLVLLIAQAVVFLIWAGLSFVVLFHLRRRAVDMTGRQFPGPFSFIEATREWLDDPEERRRKVWFFGLTAVLVVLSIGQALARV